MEIYEKIVRLLVASGNVSEEKVEQARKLAESLVWDGEVRPTQRAVDAWQGCPSCSLGLCPDGNGGFIPCTICGNTVQPKTAPHQ